MASSATGGTGPEEETFDLNAAAASARLGGPRVGEGVIVTPCPGENRQAELAVGILLEAAGSDRC